MLEYLSSGWGLQFMRAFATSITAAVFSFSLSILIGIALSLWAGSRFKGASTLVKTYTYIFRSLPDILLLILLFYSIDGFIQSAVKFAFGTPDIRISPLVPGIIATSIVLGAYSTELLKAGWAEIPAGQNEAARSLGLSGLQSLLLITMPQVYRKMIPHFGSLWLISMKETALLSVIGISDVVRTASLGARSTGAPFTFYGIAIFIFIAFAVASSKVFRRLEIKSRRTAGAV
ncbi:hypothetical protein N183_32870 [Sinorhizobium sp. Sb3]|uniref:ABC transporter permease subunit n=1 Tax=Sinorhizobium sp. Sb3 TaxID=1358417 RepID=UPI000729689A|nr:ABC transporter permease subunit [Sinorhizobium sp. Sb3]KSV66852.1 hypothetical protein N183_32870 [Sinorhizobium sp. Sb3]